jgi:2-polyprenyl-3-methyl-5-hydroxy-6-metoxy-1,4-benzoquinol methylase
MNVSKLNLIKQVLPYLACPNDGNNLEILECNLFCDECESNYKILDSNFIELLPKTSFQPKSETTTKMYSKYYDDLSKLGHSSEDKKRLWGIQSNSIPKGFFEKSRDTIMKFIDQNLVCDVGAGIGDYSFPLAKKSKIIFHCDLDLEAINYSRKIAYEQNLNNILFIRCDYMFLPFKNSSLPCITCIDVLERGEEHDNKLLEQLTLKIKSHGICISDFHSKERMKLTRVKDFGDRYSKNDLKSLFSKNDMNISEIIGMGFLPQLKNIPGLIYYIGNAIGKIFLPPARWLVISTKN